MTNNIASERVRKNLRQTDLADRLEVSIATITNWETGKVDIPGTKIAAMATLFGCSTDYILGLSNERINRNTTTDCTTEAGR